MANAIILFGGKVIQASNLTDTLFHYKSGFVMSFVVGSTKYTYCAPGDFRSDDQGSNPDGGYYQEQAFLDYLAKLKSLEDIQSAYILQNSLIITAVKGDTLVSHTLYIQSPYTDFCKFSNYSWPYDPAVDVVDANNNIIFPTDDPPTVYITLNVNALSFYNNNIALVTSDDFPDDKGQGAYYLALCALEIDMINRDVFPGFNTDPDLANYIINQNIEWSGVVFNQPDLNDIEQYYLNLQNYYIGAYSNQRVIQNAAPETRLFWLANVLSVSGLAVFSVDDKINILTEAINTQMISSTLNDEDFLIKVIQSVSLVPAQIDDFLDKIISTTFNSFPVDETQTLFEAIYKNVVDNRTATYTMGLYNLPPDRKIYIQTLYNLWLTSKYNPYYDDPSYTQPPDPLGFYPESFFMTQSGRQNYDIDKAPPVLAYSSGNNSVDDYTTSFSYSLAGETIAVSKNTTTYDSPEEEQPIITSSSILYGTFHLFQPVVTIGYQSDLDIALPQLCYIPVFYLYYADDYKSIKDFDFGVLLLETVLTTYEIFNPGQSISYIKGLSLINDLSDSQKVIMIWQAVEGVSTALEFTAGEAAALANYIVNTSTDPDIAKFQTTIDIFLFALTIATVASNILVKQRLIVAADNVISEQQTLIGLGKPVNLPDEVINAVAAIANNKPLLINLMQSKIDNLGLSEITSRFGNFNATQQFDFFRGFYNVDNSSSTWTELNALKPTNPDPSVTYNLVDIWANDVTASNPYRSNIPFLNWYGYEVYQEPDVWNHLDLITNSPDYQKSNFNLIGGHTQSNFLSINDLTDLDNLSPSDYKFLAFDPNTPNLPANMANYSSSLTAGDHIQHKNLYVWDPNASEGKYSINTKFFKKITFKTQFNPDWSQSRIQEEVALALSKMTPDGPPKQFGQLFGQSSIKESQKFLGVFTDGSQLSITQTNYEWQSNKLYKNYISSILIIK